MTTVRDAAVQVLRDCGSTTVFGNPGSTEVPLLAELPADVKFVLCLHEASVVGAAIGYALATGRPAVALLHTTAGMGNAVGAIATARENRAPIVILVGQQDRRHLAAEPFLAGRLRDLAGEYPVAVHEPVRATDVPGALRRAHHEASLLRGPAVVVVPMDDWGVEHIDLADPAPRTTHQCRAPTVPILNQLTGLVDSARSPALVVGARCDSAAAWQAVGALAERIGAPVWQESFGAAPGFAQDDDRFAGHLPSSRTELRSVLSDHDLIVVVGAHAFRQYQFDDGPFVNPGTSVVVLSPDLQDVLTSTADLGVVVDIPAALTALAGRITQRPRPLRPARRAPRPPSPAADQRLNPRSVYQLLSAHLPTETALLEESPSNRLLLHDELPARHPLGFLSAAMGGLGFALPAAVGIRLAQPERPVVAVLGDGSAMYSVQGLWTAVHYHVGVLFIVLSNGRYAIMDRLAQDFSGTPGPWPSFPELSLSTIARGMGCASSRVETAGQLSEALAALAPNLARATYPTLIEITLSD